MNKTSYNCKLIVKIFSDREHNISVVGIDDLRTHKPWTDDQIKERGLFGVITSATKKRKPEDRTLIELKETLNWNLGGDTSKYMFLWEMAGNKGTYGRTYIYE